MYRPHNDPRQRSLESIARSVLHRRANGVNVQDIAVEQFANLIDELQIIMASRPEVMDAFEELMIDQQATQDSVEQAEIAAGWDASP